MIYFKIDEHKLFSFFLNLCELHLPELEILESLGTFYVRSRPLFASDTEWVVANQDLCERQGYVVRNLPVGEKINFRVVAVNIAGRSPPATLAQPVTIREIMGESDGLGVTHTLDQDVFYGFHVVSS